MFICQKKTSDQREVGPGSRQRKAAQSGKAENQVGTSKPESAEYHRVQIKKLGIAGASFAQSQEKEACRSLYQRRSIAGNLTEERASNSQTKNSQGSWRDRLLCLFLVFFFFL